MNRVYTRMSFASQVLEFNRSLHLPTEDLPEGVEVMNPFRDPDAWEVSSKFFEKYYNDDRPRVFLIGINPGRFGSGITGVNFADPIRLERECGIPNPFEKKAELSSIFIFEVIKAYGGPAAFYSDFYVAAVSPLGFVKEGRNLNYYDDKHLQKAVEPFIIDCLRKQIAFGTPREVCICVGEGSNYKYLSKLNEKHEFFEDILPVPHPRFILQYRRRRQAEFVEMYLQAMRQCSKLLNE